MPWLLALLASCGDDGTSTTAPASSDGTESTTTASTTAVADESSTSAPGTSGLTSGGTSSGSGSGTTGADDLAPVAIDDTYFATQDLALAVAADAGVAANDVDDGALGVSDFDAMSQGGGTVQLAPDGSVAYTPASGFWGRDSFGYTIADAAGATASATVTVYVAPVLIPLGDVADGFGGFVLDGGPGDESGSAVGRAGDVNGDGRDDLIVGAPVAGANGSNAGRVYVVFGKADTDPVALTNLGDGGFAIDGAAPDDAAGASLGGGMDLDGDGLAELLVGASHADPNGASSGRAYVVFGKADTDPIDLAMLSGAGFTLSGELAGDRAWFLAFVEVRDEHLAVRSRQLLERGGERLRELDLLDARARLARVDHVEVFARRARAAAAVRGARLIHQDADEPGRQRPLAGETARAKTNPPLPACGERVGVRGNRPSAGARTAPHCGSGCAW
jgi:hypothetical protein